MATLTLQPDATAGKDADIEQTSGSGAGGGTSLSVGVIPSGKLSNVYRSLLEFDISSIAAGSTINTHADTRLRLNITAHDSGRAGQVLARCTRPGDASGWLEASVTWIVYKTSNNWTTAGGDVSATNAVSFSAPSATGAFDIGASDANFAALLQDALDSRSGIFSVRIKGPETGGIGANIWIFDSSDHGTAGNRPELKVDYTAPGGAARRRSGWVA